MSNPVIDAFTMEPAQVIVGQEATFTLSAHDPDARQIVAHAVVTDSAGHVQEGDLEGSVSDPLAASVEIRDKVSGELLATLSPQAPGFPAIFKWTP